jgi:hypothetical protein
MQYELLSVQDVILSYTIAFCGIGLACAASGTIFFWLRRRLSRHNPNKQLHALYTRFHDRISYFEQQVALLQEHAEDYVAVFDTQDWQKLTEELDTLKAHDNEITGLIRAGNFAEAQAILNRICLTPTSATNSPNADPWAMHVRISLKRVIHNLEVTSTEITAASESHRRKKHRPTLVTLADVKKRLLEDEVMQRELLK